MKKLVTVVSVLAAFASAPSFAKTEGNYVGVDIHRASVKAHNNYRQAQNSPNDQDLGTTNTGYGITYKYAVNFDKMFIAPGLFYERIGAKITDREDVDQLSLQLKERSGIKLDFGYDLSDNSAIYFTNGISRVGLETGSQDSDGLGLANVRSRHQLGYFYGLGLSSNIDKNVVVSFEYNTQRLSSKSIYNDTGKYDHRFKTQIDMFKINLAYQF